MTIKDVIESMLYDLSHINYYENPKNKHKKTYNLIKDAEKNLIEKYLPDLEKANELQEEMIEKIKRRCDSCAVDLFVDSSLCSECICRDIKNIFKNNKSWKEIIKEN
jgi:nucleoside-triphosphatase THEP1